MIAAAPVGGGPAERLGGRSAEIDVRLERVTKQFGDVAAVDDLSLDIEEGEFFSLLGPSGCGRPPPFA